MKTCPKCYRSQMYEIAGVLLEIMAWLSAIAALYFSVSLMGKASGWQILLLLHAGCVGYIVLHALSRTVLAVKEAIRLFPQLASDVAEARNDLMDAKKAISALEKRLADETTQAGDGER